MTPTVEVIDNVAGNIERITLTQEQVQHLWDDHAALRAALEKHENAARENLISARIIEAENKGRNYGIARDARFILERTQAALAAGGAK